MTRDWLFASSEEWEAEVARRWAEIDADNQPDPDDDEDDALSRLMAEDLLACQ
ncbi:hypothetical protein GCM10008171_01790 [Methylopila jiangsuensis]|uniref:Uncharacterized protein n=1 Tax=Methylopila jiangsuensis TaxID=586230 RepID=A0A9W6JCD6_9HYPH|nr:hypothetical protein [Methylopila jiangsuensis]MDR6287345.1 hypothetical protein [Methylopila jiangsuensis]GLK74926.1 hypothetical protein GCM10008171_01790 [Methylopila jiangsuensis]